MTRLICILTVLLISVWAGAEDKEVKVRTYHFADKELESHTALDADGQASIKDWIKLSKCEYISPDQRGKKQPGDRPAVPEIFQIEEKSCDDGGPIKAADYCEAVVHCENRNMNFAVQDVFCKAVSPKSCPSAIDCAMDTHLTRAMIDANPRGNTKQTGVVMQDMRGWSRDHTNRYNWVETDEQDLKNMEVESKGDDE